MDRESYTSEYSSSWALVIGINAYSKASPLEYAKNDAKAISTLLIKKYQFPKNNVTILIDKKASKSAIMDCFFDLATDKVGPNDRILVFFAGHGYTRTGRRGEVGFLIPFDGTTENLASLIRWDDLTRNAELVRAKHILFIMDACYGGLAITRSLPAGSMRFLKDMLQRFSRQVLTAGKANEVVADSGGPLPKHSVFTGHLLQALEGNAATPDGIITANGVMSYVYERVSKDQNSRQTPHYGYVDGDGDFIFQAPQLSKLLDESPIDKDLLISVPATLEKSNADVNLVDTTKQYISDHRYTIKLHDLVVQKVREILYLTSEDNFPVQTAFDLAEFVDRLSRYEAITADLQTITVCLAHWGDQIQEDILRKLLARVNDNYESTSGKVIWLRLRYYPTLILIYSGGIAAISSGKYDNLATILLTKVESPYNSDKTQELLLEAGEAILQLERAEVFKKLPEHERLYVPRSQYFFKLLQPTLDDILFLGRSYEEMFDRFEVFMALVHADLISGNGGRFWGPFGRFAYKYRSGDDSSIFAAIINDADQKKEHWPPLQAGFFRSSYDRFREVATKYEEMVSRLNWY